MIELYHSTHSTCSQKVRICLAEKGLASTGHHLNLRRFDQLKPEFLALNPAGLVPVLVDGGQVLTVWPPIINEYLEDAYVGELNSVRNSIAIACRLIDSARPTRRR